jgi:hypothetical protein
MEQQLKQQLRELRLDTEKWFAEIDKKIGHSECFICNENMDINEAHNINLDGEVTALVCWKCYERNIEEFLINERGEED